MSKAAVAVIVDNDAADIGALYQSARSGMVAGVLDLIEAGKRLLKKKASLGHGRWLPWLEDNEKELGFGEWTAGRLIKAYNLWEANSRLTQNLDEEDATKLCRLIWGNANLRGTQGTGDNEWYTPEEYLLAARDVLGDFDLDPASSHAAQQVVRANKFYTEQDDGLNHEWRGRVWLNPPYAQPHIENFMRKMVSEVTAGRVRAGIMLTHNYTDTEWFHVGAGACSAICFTRGRIKFYQPGGERGMPTQGQAFFYFGPDTERFREVFSSIGFIVTVAR